ncbi:uncharacterized protein P884DRAFT_332382 [Thermothelomyces heterothallicus CBS 202.75]|uniref:uncharacterized protein n=1 Tax=Thermothelomyces heterothallicus CBS 202.75 TaxID=1149848 RepID=UPI003743ADB7
MSRKLKWTVRSTSKRLAINISDGTYDQLKYLEWQKKRKATLGHQELALDRVVDVLERETVDYGIMNDMSSILPSDDSYKASKSVGVAVDLDIQDLRERLSEEKGHGRIDLCLHERHQGVPFEIGQNTCSIQAETVAGLRCYRILDVSNIPVDSNDASLDVPADAGDADDATVSRKEGSEASDD